MCVQRTVGTGIVSPWNLAVDIKNEGMMQVCVHKGKGTWKRHYVQLAGTKFVQVGSCGRNMKGGVSWEDVIVF